MVLVQAVVLRDRIEIVRDAVEEQAGHVGVTVLEAVGHGRQRGVTHEYRGRVFESRFLPKAVMQFVVADHVAERVMDVVCDAAATGEVGSGIAFAIPLGPTRHIRTGLSLEEFGE